MTDKTLPKGDTNTDGGDEKITPGKEVSTDYKALFGGIAKLSSGIQEAYSEPGRYKTSDAIGDVGTYAGLGAGIGTAVGGPIIGTAIGAVVGGVVGYFKRKSKKKELEEAQRKRAEMIKEAKRKQNLAYNRYRDKVFNTLKEEKIRTKRRKQDVIESYDTSQMDAQIVEGSAKYNKLVGDISTVSSNKAILQAGFRSKVGAIREAHYTRIEDELDKIQKMVQYIDVETEESKGLKNKAAHDQAQEAVKGYGDLRESLYA